MAFRAVIVNEHSKVSYQNNHLVFRSAERTEQIHLSEIELLILETTDIAITTMLLSRLMDENIAVIFCDSTRLPKSYLMPYYGRHDSSLTIQKQIAWTKERKREAFHSILYQKIQNQSDLLRDLGFAEKADAILVLLGNLEIGDPGNREGHASRILFNTLYGQKFSREQESDINAALNYGYTLLMSLFAREIVKCGCLTQLGIGHANQFNPFNLASDFMEPFRPLVDEIVYTHQEESFSRIKRQLLQLFLKTYPYEKAKMFLSNIASHYTKHAIGYLNENREKMPRITRG
jgi:CRISPR-associated endonuclease Cas1 subtype II